MTTKAASKATLEELHALVARSYTERITMDIEDKVPTDAATLAGAAKFLKDNNISADPADSDDLSKLREKLIEQRKGRGGSVVALAEAQRKMANGE